MPPPTSAPAENGTHAWRRAVVARGLAFAALWVILMPSAKPGDVAMGALAALCATGASLRLLPPAAGRVRIAAVLRLVPHLLWGSIVAGIDVARRAFARHPRLATGFVDYPVSLPPGQARNTFASITSLLPGSVPVSDREDAIVYHALDTTQPVVEALRAEELRLAQALVAGERHA